MGELIEVEFGGGGGGNGGELIRMQINLTGEAAQKVSEAAAQLGISSLERTATVAFGLLVLFAETEAKGGHILTADKPKGRRGVSHTERVTITRDESLPTIQT